MTTTQVEIIRVKKEIRELPPCRHRRDLEKYLRKLENGSWKAKEKNGKL